jgi:hypothetical protein
MVDDQPTIATSEQLRAISARLLDRAETINQVTLADLAKDIRVAAGVCSTMSSLRFRIMEIAEKALIHDGAAIRCDLLALLDNGEGQ